MKIDKGMACHVILIGDVVEKGLKVSGGERDSVTSVTGFGATIIMSKLVVSVLF